MRIAVDMDEVLAQFVKKVLDRWNRENGTSFKRENFQLWDMKATLGPEADVILKEWCGEDTFFRYLQPVPGAIKGFNSLIDAGHDVLVATAVLAHANYCYDDKRAWMRDQFPRWNMDNFIACARKGFIDADILIDDGPHNIEAWLKAGKSGAVLLDAPWNQSFQPAAAREPNRFTRVKNWDEIVAYVERRVREG